MEKKDWQYRFTQFLLRTYARSSESHKSILSLTVVRQSDNFERERKRRKSEKHINIYLMTSSETANEAHVTMLPATYTCTISLRAFLVIRMGSKRRQQHVVRGEQENLFAMIR